MQIPINPDQFESGYVYFDVLATIYPHLSVGDKPDDSSVYILADVLIDELIALDDQDQAEQTRQHGSQASEEEVLEIGPKSFFLRFLFHRFAIFASPALTAGCREHTLQGRAARYLKRSFALAGNLAFLQCKVNPKAPELLGKISALLPRGVRFSPVQGKDQGLGIDSLFGRG